MYYGLSKDGKNMNEIKNNMAAIEEKINKLENDSVELTGTEKQIEWAKKIRRTALEYIANMTNEDLKNMSNITEEQRKEMIERLQKETSSVFFIEQAQNVIRSCKSFLS